MKKVAGRRKQRSQVEAMLAAKEKELGSRNKREPQTAFSLTNPPVWLEPT